MKKVIIYKKDAEGNGINKNISCVMVDGTPAEINIVGADPTMIAIMTNIIKVTGCDLAEGEYNAILALMKAHKYQVKEVKETVLRITVNSGGRSNTGSDYPWGSIIVDADGFELATKVLAEFQDLSIGSKENVPSEAVIEAAVDLIKRIHMLSINSMRWSIGEEDPI